MTFPEERAVFLREYSNGMYGVKTYFFAKVMADIPNMILIPIFYGSIIYFAIGLNTVHWWKFVVFLALAMLLYFTSAGFALVISAMISDKQLAVTLIPVLILPFMLFAGFFVN